MSDIIIPEGSPVYGKSIESNISMRKLENAIGSIGMSIYALEYKLIYCMSVNSLLSHIMSLIIDCVECNKSLNYRLRLSGNIVLNIKSNGPLSDDDNHKIVFQVEHDDYVTDYMELEIGHIPGDRTLFNSMLRDLLFSDKAFVLYSKEEFYSRKLATDSQ